MRETSRFSKHERALLRSLAEEAWEAELREALEGLFEQFCRWAEHDMSSFELNELIHEYHNGTARELYKRYVLDAKPTAIAYAIAAGYLGEEDVDPALRDKLVDDIETFRTHLDAAG
jgi:hypothetical protein